MRGTYSFLSLSSLSLSQMSAREERGLWMARQTVADYCSEVQSLLSLLSLCLRTVQEADLITRQFTRSLFRERYSEDCKFICE